LPKSHSKSVREDVGSSLEFWPHAIIATDRSVPAPIFVAALIGVEKILRIDFDTSLPEETYVQRALAKLPERTIAFGRAIGVTVNCLAKRTCLRGSVRLLDCGKYRNHGVEDRVHLSDI
jgi:hypothetical protein